YWGGEMGRLPVIQNEKNIGRDHNTYGFSSWFAGGGFKAGHVHGATDELGHRAVEDVVTHADYHATLLHLFGLDHAALTFRRPHGGGRAGGRRPGADRRRVARQEGLPPGLHTRRSDRDPTRAASVCERSSPPRRPSCSLTVAAQGTRSALSAIHSFGALTW